MRFARWALRPGGRLVFFLPTVTDEYAAVDVPSLAGMELVANSCQDFGNWGRRVRAMCGWERAALTKRLRQLITMRKTASDDGERPNFPLDGLPSEDGPEHVPAHKGFRDKFFAGFKREDKDS